jgi:hypothetical protein
MMQINKTLQDSQSATLRWTEEREAAQHAFYICKRVLLAIESRYQPYQERAELVTSKLQETHGMDYSLHDIRRKMDVFARSHFKIAPIIIALKDKYPQFLENQPFKPTEETEPLDDETARIKEETIALLKNLKRVGAALDEMLKKPNQPTVAEREINDLKAKKICPLE